jgi:NADP-dependent 3-hydroxy acid dehydrogenase YdfG
MLDVNVLGLSVCTKQAFQSMKERSVEDGHIIHINRFYSRNSLSFALSVIISFLNF